MVKNGPFRTCFFDRTAKSNIRTADSKREFFALGTKLLFWFCCAISTTIVNVTLMKQA